MIPSGRLWTSLALLTLPAVAAGFFPAIWGFILALDGALLGLAALDLLVARRVPLELRRELQARLQVGVKNRVELHVVHAGRLPVLLRIKDDAPPEFEVSQELLEARVGARTRTTLAYDATPGSRGRFAFGDLHARVRGPLGLVWHERRWPAAVSASVFPDMRGASRLLLADGALDLVNLGLRTLRQDGRGSEFARLRDYAQGDSVRDVDWKATARRSRPVTRVMESERCQTILVGVDAGRAMAARVDGLTKLDHAVNAALFLAFVAVRNGDRVGLAVFADGVHSYLPPAAGRLQYRRVVEALYGASPRLTCVDYLALFKELSVRLTKRSLLALFTDFVDEDQAATLVDPVRRLAHRHVPIVLSVKDAGLARLLSSPTADAEAAYQHAVASELLLEREALKRKLGRDGVKALDVDPSQLSLVAVNAYLDVKARGVL